MLREFPPPRLAKLAPNVTQQPRTLTAECGGELTFRTRANATTLPVREAHGTFTLPGGTNTGLDATLSVALPPELAAENSSSSELTWRVLEVRAANEGDGSFATVTNGSMGGAPPNPSSFSIVAQVEYNRVRTQNVHSLVFETEDPTSAPHKVHLLRLALDTSAHRLRLPVETATATERRPASWPSKSARRVELNLHCGLTETDRSHL